MGTYYLADWACSIPVNRGSIRALKSADEALVLELVKREEDVPRNPTEYLRAWQTETGIPATLLRSCFRRIRDKGAIHLNSEGCWVINYDRLVELGGSKDDV